MEEAREKRKTDTRTVTQYSLVGATSEYPATHLHVIE